ncbi:unnamed protein product [Sphacelaria rigidula]
MSAGGTNAWLYAGLGTGIAVLFPAILLLLGKKRKSLPEPVQEEEVLPGRSLIVYFGSQTGTAESFAQILVAEGRRHGFSMTMVDLEDFSAQEMLETGKAIFCVATYGDGEPTDNAVEFSAWLDNNGEELAPDHLATLDFTVFGLGNKQYDHYNFMGRKTNEGLEKLGAQRMYAYGEGDDDDQLEEDFEAWKEGLWDALVARFGGKGGVDGVDKASDIPFSVKLLTEDEVAGFAPTPETGAASSSKFYWQGREATVVANKELRSVGKSVGSTRHIEIDLEGTGVQYQTADNLAVLPLNDHIAVERLCTTLGYDPNAIFVVQHDNSHKPIFPTPCTVRDALLRFMDVTSIPRRNLLEQLVPYVVDDAERETLRKLSSKEGREEYHRVVEAPARTLAELILESFSSLTMPLQHFLHIVPHLHPRYYTISSSSSVSPSRVHITVAVLEQERGEGRVYRGICSTFLSKLDASHTNGEVESNVKARSHDAGPRCTVFVRPSTFRLPSNATTPIIMIGPGTGVAPMRALLQERSWQKVQGGNVGRNWLYFGCRRRDEDYIYQNELEAYKANGTLDRLRLAFSREDTSKVYVQHLLHQDATEVWELLVEGAYVYVCGGTRMGTDVHNELTRIAQEKGSMDLEDSKEFMHSLQNDGRYVQELWS